MRKRIVILVHENTRLGPDGRVPPGKYFVTQLGQLWEEEGLDVRYITDPTKPADGDLLFVHVDLSVTPEPYLDMAKSYSKSVNAKVRDIRKSVISKQLVRPCDDWDGPVIVKTDLNYGGFPERFYTGAQLQKSLSIVKSPGNYHLYSHRRKVPAEYFENPELVVERFLPEMSGDGYCIRSYNFLGDHADTFILYSKHPLVKINTITGYDFTKLHPDILKIRHAMGFDYGKFDYVVRYGQAILLDTNKTPGNLPVTDARLAAMLRDRAQGIHAFL